MSRLARSIGSASLLVLALCLVWDSLARPAAQSARDVAFEQWFTGRTMRVDYYHTGRGESRIVTLDRVVDDGEWAGGERLLDDTGLGPYRVEVFDAATSALIFSRGFASLYGEWETAAASRTEWRTFHHSVRVPWPQRPVQVVLKRRDAERGFRELWSVPVDPESRFVNRAAPVPAGTLTTIAGGGPPATRVDLLFVGEGYTAAQGTELIADARRLTDALFSHEPYKGRRAEFTVRVLHVPASAPGVHRPQANSPRRTAISTEYNVFDSERYMLTLDNRALRDAAGGIPYDALVVLANEEYYGGGGVFNDHAAVAAKNAFADYLFVHEFSHHFAALADEYYTSDVAYETGLRNRPEPWEPNITAMKKPAGLKWRDLVAPGTPLPTPWGKEEFDERATAYQASRASLRAGQAAEEQMVTLFRQQQQWEQEFFARQPHVGKVGAFEGAGYESKGLYRPEADCVMFSRNPVPFCRVCQRTISRVIDLHVAR